jgi:hypothetical protein
MIFTPKIAGQRDSLVVMAGGASAGRHLNDVRQYIHKNNSWLLAANYNYGLKSHYTYFGDRDKFFKQVKNITSDIIVSDKIYQECSQRQKYINKNGHNLYRAMSRNTGSGIYSSHRVTFTKQGFFPFNGIGTSGLACLALSLFFQPSSILLVGFDGPSSDASFKTKYDGTIVKYGKPEKRLKEIRYLSQSLLPTLIEHKISLFTYADVEFYGMEKQTLGLQILENL